MVKQSNRIHDMLKRSSVAKEDVVDVIYGDRLCCSSKRFGLMWCAVLANFLNQMRTYSKKRLEEFLIDRISCILLVHELDRKLEGMFLRCTRAYLLAALF